MIHEILEETQRFVDKLKKMKEVDESQTFEKMSEKYGESIIRIHWMYADNAAKNKSLKLVCRWSNGDEGYIAVEGEK